MKLCRAIREKCPNARVVWHGMWYPSTQRYQSIQDACNATGCRFISYADIRNMPNVENKIGNITKRGTATRILSGVTSVVANSATNITVNFVVSGNTYVTTLDIANYSLGGDTLTYTSEYEIISSSGVASHPSDEGFRLIANKFLYYMGYTDDKEYYKQVA